MHPTIDPIVYPDRYLLCKVFAIRFALSSGVLNLHASLQYH